MPGYGYIHPVMAVAALVVGVFFSQTSLTKMGEWDFPLRRIRIRTFLYFVLCAANLLVGMLAAMGIRAKGTELKLIAHVPLAIAVVVLALLAVLCTFGRSKPGELPGLMRWHPVLSVMSLGLILTNGFLTLLKFLKI
jgi:hypothetical protein